MASTKVPIELSSTPGIVDNSNATAITIDSSENVGIGTSSPLVKTHVHSGSDAKNIVLITGADTTSEYLGLGTESGIGYITSGSSSSDNTSLAFRYAASGVETEAMRIDSSGNVGIGTSSPRDKLDIYGGLTLTRTNDTAEYALLKQDTGGNSFGIFTNGGAIRFGANGFSTEHMRINSSGNVGIGTTSPASANSADKFLAIQGSSSSGINLTAGGAYGGAGMELDSGNNLTFYTGGTEHMRVASNGTTLVGTTYSGLGAAFVAYGSGSGADQISMTAWNGGGSGAKFMEFVNSGGSGIGSITQTASNTTQYNTTSDARLKDVTGSARGLEVINALNPVAFNWKEDGHADEGLLAQEVLEIVPNAVSGSEEEYYQMDYSKLVTHLVAGMKEQQVLIEQLQAEVALLKGE